MLNRGGMSNLQLGDMLGETYFSHAAGGGAFTPASLTGLVAWYKATDGVYTDAGTTLATNGQTVQQWNDQSGNGFHLKQATSGNRPTYQSSGFNTSFPDVNFTVAGSTWMATTADTVAMGTGLVGSVFGVARVTTSGGTNARLVSYLGNGQTTDTGSNHSAAWVFVSQGSSSLRSFRGSFFAADFTFNANTNYRFGNIYDNTNDTNYINNVAGTPVGASSLTWTSPGTVILGAETTSAPSVFWDGPICEIVMTNTGLNSTDRSNLDAYFKTKWGL